MLSAVESVAPTVYSARQGRADMDTHDRSTRYSRRDFGKLALGAIPAASIWGALGETRLLAFEKINSRTIRSRSFKSTTRGSRTCT